MGWSSGSEIADKIWDAFKDCVPEDKKPEKAEALLRILESQDWDCQDEAEFVREYFKYKAKVGFVLKGKKI